MSDKLKNNFLPKTKYLISVFSVLCFVLALLQFSQIINPIVAQSAGPDQSTGLVTSAGGACTPASTDSTSSVTCIWANGPVKDGLGNNYNVGLTATNPDLAPTQSNLVSRHDTFTYTTTYFKDDLETAQSPVRLNLSVTRGALSSVAVSDMVEVVSITNQWDVDRNGIYDDNANEKDTSVIGATGYNADLIGNSVYVDTASPNKPINIRPTVGGKCTTKMANSSTVSVTDTTGSTYDVGYGANGGTGCNINGAFPGQTRGKLTVVFSIKSGAAVDSGGSLYLGTGEIRGAKCILNLDSTSCDGATQVNVSGMVMYTKYAHLADELDTSVTASASIRKTNGSTQDLPAAGDTSYSIVVGDTSPIKAVDGSNLNIGTCTMGTTTVNIAYGKCIFPITTVALTAGQVIPAGTVTISDGGSPRAITGTVDYVSYTVGQQANVNPTISITSPTNGVKVALGSTVQISATAADSDGTISKVQFYLGNTLLGEDTTSPYTYSWTPTGLAAGIYSITAKATDSSSGVTTSSAVNVTITTPLSTADDIKNLTVKCDDTLISTNTKCSFTMPDYRTLPDGFQIVIGDGSSSGTCTLDVATNLVTCNSVSAGSVAGKLPIYIKIGSGAKLDTGETVNITLPLSVTVRTGGQAVIAVVVVAVTFGLGLSIFFIRRRKLKIF